jgi:nucleotide-binding universal stress UspA family protein
MKGRFRIVVGIDFSPLSEMALDEAVALALRQGAADLHLVHVIDAGSGPWSKLGDSARMVEAQLSKEKLGDLVEAKVFPRCRPEFRLATIAGHVRLGDPGTEIARIAGEVGADVIFVGTRGHHGLSRVILGSVAEKVVRSAPCAVTVVRPKGERTEATPDPACHACLETRESTGGRSWWCPDHARPHVHGHPYVHSTVFDVPNRTLTFGG